MRSALNIVAGWLMIIGSLACISCQGDQSNERIANERNREQPDSDVKKDAQLVVDMSTGHYATIEMAKRAGERSENREVKNLAGMLQTDHTTMMNQLKEYAMNKNISLPGAASEQVAERSKRMAENNRPDEFEKKVVCRNARYARANYIPTGEGRQRCHRSRSKGMGEQHPSETQDAS